MNRECMNKTDQKTNELVNKISVGIAEVVYREKFTLLYANETFLSMAGVEDHEDSDACVVDFPSLGTDVFERDKIKEFFEHHELGGSCREIEYQHRMPDHSIRRVFLQATGEKNAQSEPLFQIVLTDISGLEQNSAALYLCADDNPLINRFTDRSLFEYHIATKTMKYMSLFGKNTKSNQIIHDYRTAILQENIVFADDIAIFHKLCDAFDSGMPLIEEELRILDEEDRFVWCKVQAATIYDNSGKSLKVIGKIENIDMQKRENEQLKEKSKRDPLTSFYNKVVIEEAVDAYLQEHHPKRCAFMVIDVDNFKVINDTRGHLFGDTVLLNIAKQMKRLFRASDLIGRAGGDEFVAFMKDVNSLEIVEKKAQEICQAFRDLQIGQDSKHLISCSIGVSLYPDHGEDYKALFKKADQALYATKGFSKNNFTVYGLPSRHRLPMDDQNNALLKEKLTKKTFSLIHIFELLFDTKDICHSINIAIAAVGEHYKLDRVFILENTKNNHGLLTYEWCGKGITSRRDLGDTGFGDMDQAPLFFCENINTVQFDTQVKNALEKSGVVSFVRYALHENGRFNGIIAFESCRDDKTWQEEEIEDLMLISKFIGSYLVKMQTQNEIEKLAYTDPLTGMWNYNKFKIAASAMLAQAMGEPDKKLAMICFDIKKFRYINDTFGFDIGDEILNYIANYLKKMLTNEMLFTRMSADKFLVLVVYQDVESLMHTLNAGMEGVQYFVSAKTGRYKLVFNAGIYLIEPEDLASFNTIVDKADIARSKAQRGHNNNYVLYCDVFRQKLMQEKEIEDLVDSALEDKEFVVYYQPKIELMSGRVKGAEALVRWRSPAKGFMAPAEFIPLFERNGFIAKLDFYVFEQVFSDLRRWIDENKQVVPISINLSRIHLSDGTFIERIAVLLKKYEIDPKYIEIELTESVFMENIANIIEVMQELKKLGFSISIDDFGSGYSSLRLLRDLPVDYLKLDKEFLDNGDSNLREQIIIMNVIRMAKTLGIKVVSEGVETDTQAMFLKSCACDLAQGYLYARPMPVEDFEKNL